METRHASGRTSATSGQARTPAPRGGRDAGDTRDTAPTDRAARVREALEAEVGVERVARVLGTDTRLEIGEGGIEVVVPDRITLELASRCLGEPLERACGSVFADEPAPPSVRYRLAEHAGTTPQNTVPGRSAGRPGGPTPERTTSPERPRRPRTRPTPHQRPAELDRFVVGRANRVAYAAAVRMADGSAPPGSVLFVHGACGMGKTHLLRGAADSARHAGGRARYATAESFTSGFVNAVRQGNMRTFQQKFRDADLLCIDDVHTLAGKSKTQQELAQTLDVLTAGGARVVLASDAPPKEIRSITDALVSRFAGGVVVRLDPPDEEMRRALVDRLTADRGLPLTPGGREALLSAAEAGGAPSVRDFEGYVTQVEMCWRVEGGEPDATMVERALRVRVSADAGGRRPVPAAEILRCVCETLGVPMDAVFGKGRVRRVVLARELSVYLIRTHNGSSFPEIASVMHRANHSTAITQMNNVRRRLEKGETLGGAGEDRLSSVLERIEDRLRRR